MDNWTRAKTNRVAQVWDCASDKCPYCHLVRGTPDYNRSIEKHSVAARSVATIVSSAAKTERSDETVADFVATVDDDSDDDGDDEDWSRSESWERARQRS